MRTAILAALLFFGAGAQVAHAQAVKIGYVDLSKALNEVEDGKAAKAKLKLEFDGKQKKLDQMQTSLKTKKDDFEKKAAMMKPDARAKKQEDLQSQFMELQQTYMQLQRELLDSEQQNTAVIGGKLKTIIERIGDRDGYNMILNIADTVVYYKRHQDITEEVVREYNKQNAKK
jgi:outer membrane protein